MSSDADADPGYVHDPAGSNDRESRNRKDEDPAAEAASDPEDGSGLEDATDLEADGFGRTGWALTAALFACTLVIPGIIYLYPYAAGSFGLTFFETYLVLPLIPAILLGLVAVWAMSAATADR